MDAHDSHGTVGGKLKIVLSSVGAMKCCSQNATVMSKSNSLLCFTPCRQDWVDATELEAPSEDSPDYEEEDEAKGSCLRHR